MNSQSPVQSSPRRLRVLVVDDDDDTRDALGGLLEHLGHEVTACASAAEGLAQLQTGRFQLVVTDHSMPPGETGSWMLDSADRQGLLRGVTAVMFTASERPEPPRGVPVVPKGDDVAALLTVLARAVAAAPSA